LNFKNNSQIIPGAYPESKQNGCDVNVKENPSILKFDLNQSSSINHKYIKNKNK